MNPEVNVSNADLDVVVVGGSWAGLAAALQLGRARRRVLVIDGGSPRNRFAHESHGFLGQDGRTPAEIGATFRAQVAAYPTVELRSGEAVDARREDDGTFTVSLRSGDSARARRLILATGVVDELPALPGLSERWGRTALHCPYCHGYEVKDARLGLLAVGERSLHLALLLPDWSADVTLFTNGAVTPDAAQLAALAARGVRVEAREVAELVGEAPALEGVRLADGDLVGLDALFTASRTRLASSLAQQLGCQIEDGLAGPFVRTDDHRETTVPGVYCAGDAARSWHNATFAVGDGVMAGVSAHQSLAMEAAARTAAPPAGGALLVDAAPARG